MMTTSVDGWQTVCDLKDNKDTVKLNPTDQRNEVMFDLMLPILVKRHAKCRTSDMDCLNDAASRILDVKSD